jgi:hypothetical protein
MADDTAPHPGRLAAAVGPDKAVRFGPVEKFSATTHSPYWLREDPFHDEWLWDLPPSFAHKFLARRELVEGEWRLVQHEQFVDPDSRVGRPLWSRCTNSEHVHRVLALLNAFHHATSRQLHAVSQFPWHRSTKYLKAPFDLGIVQRGVFQKQRQTAGALPRLYSLHDGRPLRRLLAGIDDDTARRIVGNDDRAYTMSARHIRHDVLAFELALRIMETQPNIVAVTGEHQSTPAALLPGLKHTPSFGADFVLHRHDGLRIAFEIAASRNNDHLKRTVEKWARLFVDLPRQDSGLVVVIVNAHRTRHGQMASDLRRILADVTAGKNLKSLDGTRAAEHEVLRARTQIHLASWLDWFPTSRTISPAGVGLHAASTPDGERWIAQALADPASYAYEPRGGTRWPTPTAETSLAVPPWVGVPPMFGVDDTHATPRQQAG